MINSRDIKDLTEKAHQKYIQWAAEVEKVGIKIKLTQTLRDAEYQNQCFKKGLSKCDGYKKTSRHQSGNAWDVVIVNSDGSLNWTDMEKYKILADIALDLGITAGYYFRMVDAVHFEIKIRSPISSVLRILLL